MNYKKRKGKRKKKKRSGVDVVKFAIFLYVFDGGRRWGGETKEEEGEGVFFKVYNNTG